MSQTIPCPDTSCGAPAELIDQWTFGSTHGPVEHVKTRCERGHVFTPTVDSLVRPTARPAIRVGATTRR
jgi:hypothetical protein